MIALLIAAAAPVLAPTEAAPPAARPIAAPAAEGRPALPAATEVTLRLDEALDSRSARKGHAFRVTVARDVVLGDRVAIPQGAPGMGEVTWRTGRGAFGKSGKLEIAMRSVTAGGRTIPVSGTFREAGDGNTGATIGAVLAAGVLAGALVTGHTATFEQGREFRAYTTEAIALDAGAPSPAPRPMVVGAPAPILVVTPAPVQAIAPAPVAAPVAVAPAAPIRVAASYGAAPVRFVPSAPAVAERPSREQAFARRLARQGGVRGREPEQGWTISD